jgi:hypothetical protein
MLHKLAKFTDKTISKAELNEKTNELMSELGDAIGERDQRNANVKERIARYRQLSAQAGYGDRELPEYDDDKWLDEALKEEVRGLRDRTDFTLARWDPFGRCLFLGRSPELQEDRLVLFCGGGNRSPECRLGYFKRLKPQRVGVTANVGVYCPWVCGT